MRLNVRSQIRGWNSRARREEHEDHDEQQAHESLK